MQGRVSVSSESPRGRQTQGRQQRREQYRAHMPQLSPPARSGRSRRLGAQAMGSHAARRAYGESATGNGFNGSGQGREARSKDRGVQNRQAIPERPLRRRRSSHLARVYRQAFGGGCCAMGIKDAGRTRSVAREMSIDQEGRRGGAKGDGLMMRGLLIVVTLLLVGCPDPPNPHYPEWAKQAR